MGFKYQNSAKSSEKYPTYVISRLGEEKEGEKGVGEVEGVEEVEVDEEGVEGP